MAKTKTTPEDLLSTVDVAAELGITVTRVNVLIRQYRLKAVRIGKVWIIRRGDLDPVRNRPTGRPRNKPSTPQPKPPARSKSKKRS